MEKATIYTRTGDNGTTSLRGGKRVSKDHPRVEAYGTLDELNAHIGLLAAALDENSHTRSFLMKITNTLFTIGSNLATEEVGNTIDESHIHELETAIDTLEASLAPMHGFILPADEETAARANVCRTVCRRAERQIVTLDKEQPIDPTAMKYINRLSDYLFLLQRHLLNGKEKLWQKSCK